MQLVAKQLLLAAKLKMDSLGSSGDVSDDSGATHVSSVSA